MRFTPLVVSAKYHRHIVVHEQGKQLAKDVAHHQNKAQHQDCEEHVDHQLAADKPVDQFHSQMFC